MKLNIYFTAITLFAIFFVIPILILKFTKNKIKLRKNVIGIIFSIYLIILFLGTISLLKYNYPYFTFSLNFSYDWFSLRFSFFNFSINNIIINICIFIPIGIYIFTFVHNKNIFILILIVALISLFIEIYQFVLPIYRDSEIGDIILNTFGGSLSILLCKILKKYQII